MADITFNAYQGPQLVDQTISKSVIGIPTAYYENLAGPIDENSADDLWLRFSNSYSLNGFQSCAIGLEAMIQYSFSGLVLSTSVYNPGSFLGVLNEYLQDALLSANSTSYYNGDPTVVSTGTWNDQGSRWFLQLLTPEGLRFELSKPIIKSRRNLANLIVGHKLSAALTVSTMNTQTCRRSLVYATSVSFYLSDAYFAANTQENVEIQALRTATGVSAGLDTIPAGQGVVEGIGESARTTFLTSHPLDYLVVAPDWTSNQA